MKFGGVNEVAQLDVTKLMNLLRPGERELKW